jgi:putative transposase
LKTLRHTPDTRVGDATDDGRGKLLVRANPIAQTLGHRAMLEAGFSLTGRSVVAVMERLLPITGLPASITVDRGTEFMSKALEAWAYYRGVQLDFTRPRKPTDNIHIESFNGLSRRVPLNVHQFLSIDHARATIEAWRQDYNEVRPHGSLGDLTPAEFIKIRQERRTEKAGLL